MDRIIVAELQKARAEWMLRNQFFSYGNVGLLNSFTLSRSDPFGEEIEFFTVSSAGVVVITQDPEGVPSVLLVNEEAARWDIPSGHVELSDASPLFTAQRELEEETMLHLSEADLLPLCYAVKTPSSNKAGVQFFTVSALPAHIINACSIRRDSDGRIYYSLNVTTGRLKLALEPLALFLHNPNLSLLTNSHHPWAYNLTRIALVEKLNLAREAGYTNQSYT